MLLRNQLRHIASGLGRLRRLRRLRDESGNAGLLFALLLPVVLGASGLGIDYVRAASARTRMQAVADAAAISSARELQMAKAEPDKIAAIATSYVTSQLDDVRVQAKVDADALTVQVILEKDVSLTVGPAIWRGDIRLRAAATAKMTSGLPLCLVGLDTASKGTIKLEEKALLTAPACLVYSNSKSPQGLISMDDAALRAGFICSAGGKVKTKDTNYSPPPQTDCPVIPDPLAARQPPSTAGCAYTNQVVNGGVVTLQPGVYCGGLRIVNGAQATLAPGIYVIKDGPFIADGNAVVEGKNVAIFLSGAGANLIFETTTTVSLTAPKDGPLTGILLFDDPSGAAAPAD